jgi:hypothetical protein
MASITGKNNIFFVTSPRTPNKLQDEIRLLVDNFTGRRWNAETQAEYYMKLTQQDFFNGSPGGDVAFKARDRINRAPKALGLVELTPTVKITDAGKQYLDGNRNEEIFLKQLLKFQLHSPFHTDNDDVISVKPYLELIKLINQLGGLTKTEIGLFVIQLTKHQDHDTVKNKINAFRAERKTLRNRQISYKTFVVEWFNKELKNQYSAEIESGDIGTRERSGKSLSDFLDVKRRNHLDYADASIRYLRATKLFSLDPYRAKIYVSEDKKVDVDFICSNISNIPYAYTSEDDYKNYLYASNNLSLLVDNKPLLLQKIAQINTSVSNSLQQAGIDEIKDKYDALRKEKLEKITEDEVSELQTYDTYSDVVDVYDKIHNKEIVDPPLFLEWNTWRAFTMLDDGSIKGNFRVDDDGMPLYTAPGNTADIECEYTDFQMIVEVTMSSGQRQYEMEGEPVARHLGNKKKATDKETYCIFIAPTISEATLAHYFILHKTPVAHYGGKSKIIPLPLDTFKVMLGNAKQAEVKPKSSDLKQFLDKVSENANTASDETEWLSFIDSEARIAFAS